MKSPTARSKESLVRLKQGIAAARLQVKAAKNALKLAKKELKKAKKSAKAERKRLKVASAAAGTSRPSSAPKRAAKPVRKKRQTPTVPASEPGPVAASGNDQPSGQAADASQVPAVSSPAISPPAA